MRNIKGRTSFLGDRLLEIFLDQLDCLVQHAIDEHARMSLLRGLIVVARLGIANCSIRGRSAARWKRIAGIAKSTATMNFWNECLSEAAAKFGEARD